MKADYVSAIIFKGNKVLVQHHVKTQSIVLVSGKVDEGEDSFEAIVRELQEETGLLPSQVEFGKCIVVNNVDTGSVGHDYEVEVISGNDQVNAEPTKHYWQDYRSRDEILELSRTIPLGFSLRRLLLEDNRLR